MAKTDTKKMSSVQKKKVTKMTAPKSSRPLAVKVATKAPAKTPVKKTVKVPTVKAVAKAPAKAIVKKAVSQPAKAKPSVAPQRKPAPLKPSAEKTPVNKTSSRRGVRFSKTDLKSFQMELLILRDRITSQSGSMRSAALQRTDEVNIEEGDPDAFMRLQTLEQVGTQQGIVTKINEALHAISKGTYGICDTCGELINKARLTVLPFARNCIKCQSEMERLNRYGRYR